MYYPDRFYGRCPKFIINNFKKIKTSLVNISQVQFVIVRKIELQFQVFELQTSTIQLLDTNMRLTTLMIQLLA